ncbi:VWA domain-containing protein [Streptomyces sp. DSM 44917]|uniref:VWA domain-containing protein n=1 Tax=Streptomyces boetiae TaxID=3075541 RepID=A0ABU2L9U2_9ACTN|nr:VWA domain-containing protein [Streptomyces sp. DSM 44917]MDT0308342.1 VWA domain-containing protein [Streptomyces sp. DSM 44917]
MTAPRERPEEPGGPAGRLTGLVRALREHGLRIGPGETVDAAAALRALGLDDREHLRAGLAAALLHQESQRPVFDGVFDLYFPARTGPPLAVDGPGGAGGQAPADLSRAALRDRLAEALAAGDAAALDRIAAEAVDALGRWGADPATYRWSAQQTLDRLRPQTLLARVRAATTGEGNGAGNGPGGAGAFAAGAGAPGTTAPGAQPGAFTDRLTDDEIRRRIEEFRERVRAEARRRVAGRIGAGEVARRGLAPTPERIPFLAAGRTQLAELRRTVHPLARKLATRLAARRRRATHGTIDLRRTLRRSLSTGGVPLRPAYRRRRPSRPELVLLCDVSDSVAGFAQFTMLLVHALRDEFGKVRVFAFVNRTDEVTDLVTRGAADPGGLAARILTGAAVASGHGSSDYGSALGEFAGRHLPAVTSRSTVLILGDARTNGGDPNLPALRRVAERARRVYWLNPEQPASWPTGDSVALAYANLVEMHPCRDAEQLSALIGRILPI